MDQLQSMRIFAKVVEKGSFARAAQALDLSNAVVTRHVAELETRLGTRLLHRTTRKLSLTEAGTLYLNRIESILRDIEEVDSMISTIANEPAGPLHLFSSKMLGQYQLPRLLLEYCSRFPRVVPDIMLSENMPDLVAEGFDVALVLSRSRFDVSMIARKLANSKTLLCAAPAYIKRRGVPRTPQELSEHDCLNFSMRDLRHRWPLDMERNEHVDIHSVMYANDGELLRRCALGGMGIVILPSYAADDDLFSGRLVRLLPSFDPPPTSVTLVYPSRRLLSATVQSFIDFLKEKFPEPEQDPWIGNLS